MILPYLFSINKKLFLTLILLLLAYLSFFAKDAFAAAIFYDVAPPSAPRLSASACEAPEECANTAVPGQANQCGGACPNSGSGSGRAWTKYRLTCVLDPDTDRPTGYYQKEDEVCSIGDKCVGSEIGLRAGSCTCGGHSSTLYKYCCTPQGNAEACTTQNVPQDNFTPNEGQCPGGYIVDGSRVRSSNCVPIPPPVSCTPDPNNATTECGQTGGCTNNYPANHVVEVTPSQCTDGTTTYSCEDQGVIPGRCGEREAPNVTNFTISSACTNPQTGTVFWDGTPYDTGSCGQGFWVDIDSDSSFSGSSYHKCFPTGSPGSYSTTAPSGFNGYNGASGPLSFQAGVTYYTRVYNGRHSNTRSFAAPTPNCPGSCTLSTPSCSASSSSGTTCTFTSTYSVNGVSQSSYQRRLTPDTNNSSIQTNFQSNNQTLSWTYQPGIYTAKLDAQTNSGSSPTSCFSPTFAIAQAQTSCNITTGTVTRNASGQYNSVSVSVSTTNMNQPNVWYYNTNSTCSVSQNTCPSTPWANIQSLSSINTTHTFNWNPNSMAPADGGNRTLAVTYQNSANQPTLKCSTNVNFPSPSTSFCTMTASPNPVNTNQNTFISVSVPNLSQMPASKRSEWDIDCNSSNGYEITNDVELSKTKSYPNTGSCNLRFRVVAAPGSSQVLSSCSTPLTVTSAGAPPGGGPICNGEANQICNYNGGLDCPPNSGPGSTQSITSQQHQDCVRRTGSGRAICVYCPPQRPPSGPSCSTPSPINGGPIVRPLPDGYSVEVSYTPYTGGRGDGSYLPTFSPLAKLLEILSPRQADASHIPVDFFRSNKMGFAPQGSGSLVGTQFGNHGIYFDTSSLSPRTMYYYQIETNNGSQSTYSQTYGVSTQDRPNPRKKNCDDGTNVRLRSARVVGSNPITLTFEITFTTDYSTGSFCGCNRSGCGITPPRYLKLSSSSMTAYIPWTSPSTPSRACTFPTRQCGGNVCLETEWKQQYTVALPPNTSHSFTIQGYEDGYCRRNASIGSASLTGGTSSGSALAPTTTNITSASPGSDSDRRNWFMQINWSGTATGQLAKVYRTEAQYQNRWSGTDLGAPTVINEGGSVTYKIIDDLRNVPAGTYYYGATVRQQNACFEVQTGQTPFVWNPPIPAWIQTTEGDVHSNTRITTPGGP